MLSETENALLTHVGPGTEMGKMMRRFWMPALLSEELPGPDCPPVRVRLLGERLVAFRDSDGEVGLLEEACPHRTASLAYGRNEEGGLRCIYHGWKFDVSGRCMEMPTEPPETSFKDKLTTRSYPVREIGDMIWAYLGPDDNPPPLPEFDWVTMSSDKRAIAKVVEEANYLQAIEGAIDSAHSWFLHRGSVRDWRVRSSVSMDTSPKLEAENTPYGFRYAAIRRPNEKPDTTKYVRVTQFILPYFALIPRSLSLSTAAHAQIFVPMDDHHTAFYGIFFSQDGNPVDTDETRKSLSAVVGVDLDNQYFKKRKNSNMYWQDRQAMADGSSYTGMDGFTNQDMAMQESMGYIADRTREHLGTSDVAIIRMRRRMLESLRQFQETGCPVGLDVPVDHAKIRGEQRIIPIDEPWQQVGAYDAAEPARSDGR